MVDGFFIHEITLTRYLGAGSHGDIYSDPETVTGFVVTGERLYRTADGREKLATGTVYLPKDVSVPALNSQVTSRQPGLHGRVGQATDWDASDLGLPECVELVID